MEEKGEKGFVKSNSGNAMLGNGDVFVRLRT